MVVLDHRDQLGPNSESNRPTVRGDTAGPQFEEQFARGPFFTPGRVRPGHLTRIDAVPSAVPSGTVVGNRIILAWTRDWVAGWSLGMGEFHSE